jgi:hypothetical protein
MWSTAFVFVPRGEDWRSAAESAGYRLIAAAKWPMLTVNQAQIGTAPKPLPQTDWWPFCYPSDFEYENERATF